MWPYNWFVPLQWRHNEHKGVSIHRVSNVYSTVCSGATSKLRVTGLCEGNSPVTSEFPAQRTSNAENVSIWWRHHVYFAVWEIDLLHHADILPTYFTPPTVFTQTGHRPSISQIKLVWPRWTAFLDLHLMWWQLASKVTVFSSPGNQSKLFQSYENRFQPRESRIRLER